MVPTPATGFRLFPRLLFQLHWLTQWSCTSSNEGSYSWNVLKFVLDICNVYLKASRRDMFLGSHK
jgi:hypothetical protein